MSTPDHSNTAIGATDALPERSTANMTGTVAAETYFAGETANPSRSGVPGAHVWFARIAVGIVFFLNVMCAVQFIAWPQDYAPAYGLPPTPESYAMVAGLGVAFLMWNATYPPVLANPVRFRALFAVVLAQQAIGLMGESFIWAKLAAQDLAASQMAHGIMRFVAFDGAGLVLMLVAFIVLHRALRASGHHSSTSAW